MSSEATAIRDVPARAPERINLRALLDKVYQPGGDFSQREVDVHRIRRMVTTHVNRSAHHTRHGVDPPKIGVHACAHGADACPVCRYGFPH